MQPHSFRLALCAIAAAAVTSVPAHAKTASASAQIDQFTYELIDLDLADGITPGISFFDNAFQVDSAYRGDGLTEQFIYTAGATSVARSYGATSAMLTTTGVSSTSRLVDPTAPFAVTHLFTSSGYYRSDFVLTAGTGLRVSALGTLSVDTQGPGCMGRASFGVSAQLTGDSAGRDESIYSGHYFNTESGAASHRVSAFVSTDQLARTGSFTFKWRAGRSNVRQLSKSGRRDTCLHAAGLPGNRQRCRARLSVFPHRYLRQRSARA